MAEVNRTEYSMRNASVAMVAKILAIFCGYLTRVVFTHTFTADYVSLNGLLTNVLSALNLSELGIGTALVYAMYGPAARGDKEREKSLMLLYGQMYKVIALVVLVIGAIMYPILMILMNKQPQVENLLLVYILFVSYSISSYFLAYKSMIFLVMQENYINELLDSGFLVLQNLLQIVILLTSRNYILFLLIYVGCILLRNLTTSAWAERRYPFLREKNVSPMAQEEKKEIYRNVRAMLMHKIGLVGINNTDNLILTGIVGLLAVGSYSNYYLVIGSVRQIIDRTVRGIVGSVGNLGATASKDHIKKIFWTAFFCVNWIYGFAAICMFGILDLFVGLSFGQQFVFPKTVTAVLCLNLYLNGLRQAVLIFRDTLGLFWYDRYKTIVESVVNLVVSILLARQLGTVGVFLGTTVSIVGVSIWVEPLVLYKEYFKDSMIPYFIRFSLYVLATLLTGAMTAGLCGLVGGSDLTQLLRRGFICLTLPNLIFLLLFFRSKEFRQVWERVIPVLRRKILRRS